jgi:hypothetical protein
VPLKEVVALIAALIGGHVKWGATAYQLKEL